MVIANARKKVKEARWYLNKDKRYFIKEFSDVEPIVKEVHQISNTIHDLSERKADIGLLRDLVRDLNRLERSERWQQIRDRYPKINKAMEEIKKLPIFNASDKVQIDKLMEQEHVFEADLLRTTVNELDPLIRGKKLEEISTEDWKIIVELAKKLKTDLQALVAIIRGLRKILESKTN